MKTSTIALIVTFKNKAPCWVDTLLEESEIEYLAAVVQANESEPLRRVYEFRAQQKAKEEEMGDFVEELLSKPFLNPKVQNHGINWLKSKIKIENYQKIEQQAAEIVADYAFKIYQQDLGKTDFFLVSATSQVRVRVFTIPMTELGLVG
jgi:hypothetical protein